MPLFTNEQLQELSVFFNIPMNKDVLPVRDGYVNEDSMVWWRCIEGKQHVRAEQHWRNIEEYPSAYSLKEPHVIRVEYED